MSTYSHSYLQRFRDCPLACMFHNELRLRKREAESETHHLVYGGAMHEGLRVIYSGGTLREAQETFAAHYPVQLDINDWAKTQENGIAALSEYVKRWHEEDKQWAVLRCERLDNHEDGTALVLDLVLQHKESGQIYGLDHKVTGAYLNYRFWEKFEPNAQITEYVKFIKERYGDCDGFIINAIALRHRQRAYKGEPAGPWFAFERQTFNRNEQQLEQGLVDRMYWEQRVRDAKATGLYGMNTSQCYQCEYREICKAGWSYPEDAELIDITYRRVCGRWSGEPLAPCVLDREHEGDHSPIVVNETFEVSVEV